MRIVGGAWRSRLIRFPDRPGLRPTPDRVRETLFNWLGQDLDGLAVLDLFAGSGALGFESLSRGAARAVLVEGDALAARALRDNAQALGAAAEVVQRDAEAFLRADPRRFHVIFVDPPYGRGWLERLAPLLAAHLEPDGVVYAEEAREPDLGPGWETVKRCRAGTAHGALLRRIP